MCNMPRPQGLSAFVQYLKDRKKRTRARKIQEGRAGQTINSKLDKKWKR